ncbi:hypothetical protein [Micromonospora sp. CB01531]|uniref:hypothetical protein n=1 Tax=Micromonospora sp. CB01531 TaxID=1718947 RepID=UPI000AC14BFC|nr:hypothetical protein [Micromonospora sp. CB01531]
MASRRDEKPDQGKATSQCGACGGAGGKNVSRKAYDSKGKVNGWVTTWETCKSCGGRGTK